MNQHRAGGRETTIAAIAIDYGCLNERGDLLQEAAGAPIWRGSATVIAGLAQPLCQRKVPTSMRLLNSRKM